MDDRCKKCWQRIEKYMRNQCDVCLDCVMRTQCPNPHERGEVRVCLDCTLRHE